MIKRLYFSLLLGIVCFVLLYPLHAIWLTNEPEFKAEPLVDQLKQASFDTFPSLLEKHTQQAGFYVESNEQFLVVGTVYDPQQSYAFTDAKGQSVFLVVCPTQYQAAHLWSGMVAGCSLAIGYLGFRFTSKNHSIHLPAFYERQGLAQKLFLCSVAAIGICFVAYLGTYRINQVWIQWYQENVTQQPDITPFQKELRSYAKTVSLTTKNKRIISQTIQKQIDSQYKSVSIANDQKWINIDPTWKPKELSQHVDSDTYGFSHSFLVQWKNKKTWVYVNTYPELYWLHKMMIGEMAIIFSFYVLILYAFMKKQVRIIQTLTNDIAYLENGDWSHPIQVHGQDELSQLARQMDEMRLYTYENMQTEKQVIQANHDLVTSMSHDIRTPLATLKGYLEILSLKKGEEARQEQYIQRCLKKTDELIDLSEALFKQSLHVTNQEKMYIGRIRIYEIMALLKDQIEDLKKRGYDIQLTEMEPQGSIQGNLPLIHRIFDNLSSNIIKYADKKRPVHILIKIEKGELYIRFENFIAPKQDVESNHIGLQSVQLSMKQMHGTYFCEQTKNYFLIVLTFPLCDERAIT